MSDNENRPPPSPAGAAGAAAIREYIEAKTARDERLVDLLHRALAKRYGVNPKTEEKR